MSAETRRLLKQRLKEKMKNKKEPSRLKKLKNFTKASIEHILKKAPTVPQEEIDRRYDICIQCKYLKEKNSIQYCSHYDCGCNVSKSRSKYLSKLAWADQKCPIDKWGPYTGEVTQSDQP